MGGFTVMQLTVVLVLLPGHLFTEIGKLCPCQGPYRYYSMASDTSFTSMKLSIFCCKDMLMGYHDPTASIQWSFNGEALSSGWNSSFTSDYCNGTITTTSIKMSDKGIYSCAISASNGTAKTFNMTLSVEQNIEYRKKPQPIKGSPSTVAQLKDRIAFTCESYVGTKEMIRRGVQMKWRKYFPNNTYGFADKLPNVTVTRIIDSSKETLKEELVISSVQEVHFGRYECIVTNNYNYTSFNITLTEGIPKEQKRIQQYRTTVVVVAVLLGAVLVMLLGWCRWGRQISLYCSRETSSSADHQYDVFLVHGESASRWVWSFLLPALEDSFGYTCFLPQRDMCGGEMVAESILESLEKCRRVVVVMTPCLLDSPWATWATYSGIQTALTSRARILALVLKDQRMKSDSLDSNPFLSVLKVVKKIKLPEEFERELCEQCPPYQPSDIPMQEENHQKTDLKLIIPETKVRNSSSNSLSKSQRLSNMISGSNAASREDLEGGKNKPIEVSPPVVFTFEDHGPQDPGSPNSVTPFIFSPRPKSHRRSDDSIWKSVRWCLQMICVGDPEEQFWLKLRLHIGPPLPQQAQVH